MRVSRPQQARAAMAIAGLAVTALVAACAATPGNAAAVTGAAAASRPGLPAVSAGWTLAQYSAASVGPDQGGPTPPKPGPTTLYLVAPGGHRYQIRAWSGALAPTLTDWSGDGTRALLSSAPGAWQQLTLATGATRAFTLPGDVFSASYTRPAGLAVLVLRQPGGNSADQVARYDLTGHLQRVLWTGRNLGAVIGSPDGTAVVTGDSRGLVLVSNGGTLIRRLTVSSRKANRGCQPVRWWAPGTVLASCSASGPGGLFLVPAGGGAVTQLTPPRTGTGPDLGDMNAYQLRSGLYLQAAGPCGVTFIAKARPNGSVTKVTIPGSAGTSDLMLTAYSGRLLVKAWTECGGGSALLWFDPATSSVQWLIKPPAKIQGVIGAVPFGKIGA